jgi:RHS repeat-associated protein
LSSGAAQTSYGFTNEHTSQGLVYLRSRFYSPNTGRFLTRDTWGGDDHKPISFNRWSYVHDNPIMYTDPSGHCIIGIDCPITIPIILIGVGVIIGTVACAPPQNVATPTPVVASSIFGGNIIFVDSDPNRPNAKAWTSPEINDVTASLTHAIHKYSGARGFGTMTKFYSELGISTSSPMKLVRETNSKPDVRAAAGKPYLIVSDTWSALGLDSRQSTLGHELGHYWDQANSYALSNGMASWVNWGISSTDYGKNSPGEDFTEAVNVYFWPARDENRLWTDDFGAGLALAGSKPDSLRLNANGNLDPAGTAQVQDRYDWVQLKFTGIWK